MKITVHFLGQLRHLADRDDMVVEAPPGTPLAGILESAGAGHDEKFKRIVFDDSGALRASLMVLHNDVPIDKDAPPALGDGDEITLLTAISGG